MEEILTPSFQAKNADITGKMRIMILHVTSVIIF